MRCVNHEGVATVGTCRQCLKGYCRGCLVYAFGEGRAPFCVDCALAASSEPPSRGAMAPIAPIH